MYLIGGSSNIPLALKVAKNLDCELLPIKTTKFYGGEIYIELSEKVNSDKDFVILQSFTDNVNDHILELLLITDAVKRAGATNITVVIPYCAYSRQDRMLGNNSSIGMPLISKLLTINIDKILVVDIHSVGSLTFFSVPISNIQLYKLISNHIKENFNSNYIIVTPDAGSINRAQQVSHNLGCRLIISKKTRNSNGKIDISVSNSDDIKGQNCIIIDDIIDSGKTLEAISHKLRNFGAITITAYVTHALGNVEIMGQLTQDLIDQIYYTNTVKHRSARSYDKLQELDISPLIASEIKLMNNY